MAVALLVGLVGRIALTPVSMAEAPDFSLPPAVAEAVATPTPIALASAPHSWQVTSQANRAIFRQALPYTTIPERVRLEVITYTVQSGDTVSTIAQRFKLSPYTLSWSNREALQGAPWLIQPGLVLFIPPVDGVYHTVAEGESVSDIAETYEVDADALYNEWNGLEPGNPLHTGMMVMVPDGVGEDVEWEPPPPPPSRPGIASASGSWGVCNDISVNGPGANGWFILPTGSYAVSGWVFRDPTNPGHIGLDYKCHLGEPIYAADNGVVVFAGWGGGYGNLVRVSHGNGYQTYYAHFDSFAVGCGQSVYQGQILGYCGTTGWSTGPHLHYEIRLNGVPQNPRIYEP